MGHNHVTDNINCIITYFEPTKTALSISLTCQNHVSYLVIIVTHLLVHHYSGEVVIS